MGSGYDTTLPPQRVEAWTAPDTDGECVRPRWTCTPDSTEPKLVEAKYSFGVACSVDDGLWCDGEGACVGCADGFECLMTYPSQGIKCALPDTNLALCNPGAPCPAGMTCESSGWCIQSCPLNPSTRRAQSSRLAE